MNDSSWIDEILLSIWHEADDYPKAAVRKAKAAIEAELVRIIGEDEPKPDKSRYKEHLTRSERTVITRNVLRAEIRERAGINIKGGASDE